MRRKVKEEEEKYKLPKKRSKSNKSNLLQSNIILGSEDDEILMHPLRKKKHKFLR
jgi:hypothetical protein